MGERAKWVESSSMFCCSFFFLTFVFTLIFLITQTELIVHKLSSVPRFVDGQQNPRTEEAASSSINLNLRGVGIVVEGVVEEDGGV